MNFAFCSIMHLFCRNVNTFQKIFGKHGDQSIFEAQPKANDADPLPRTHLPTGARQPPSSGVWYPWLSCHEGSPGAEQGRVLPAAAQGARPHNSSHEASLPVTSPFLMDPIVCRGDLAHQLNGTSFSLNHTNILLSMCYYGANVVQGKPREMSTFIIGP